MREGLKIIALPLSLGLSLFVGLVVHAYRVSHTRVPVVYRSGIGRSVLTCFTSDAVVCRRSFWWTNCGPSGLVVTQGWITEKLR